MKTTPTNITVNTRKSAFTELSVYCTMSNNDSHDFIEVTEWSNGEGYDVTINASTQQQTFSITYGQLKALRKLVKELDKA
jgi:hypothetical protein